jgi:uncharacterized membrane protein
MLSKQGNLLAGERGNKRKLNGIVNNKLSSVIQLFLILIYAYELIMLFILDNNSSSAALHRCSNVIFKSLSESNLYNAHVQFQVSKIHDIEHQSVVYCQFRFVGSGFACSSGCQSRG